MKYEVGDDCFEAIVSSGFPSMAGRLTGGELRWLWESYGADAVDAAMFDIETGGSEGGEPFDEIRRRLAPSRPRMMPGGLAG